MAPKYFLIAAGGTGLRCLQAFVNMCAIGMCEQKEIHCLVLDTDSENKDKKNSENLILEYEKIRKEIPSKEGFFSNDLKLYYFVPNYTLENTKTFSHISQVERSEPVEGSDKKKININRQLADVLYAEFAQEFNLAHGYRAQTHMGSYLMYHAIVDEIRKAQATAEYKKNSSLYDFLNAIQEGNTQGGSKVFVLASSFGGTGASTIPIVPKAIKDGLGVMSGEMTGFDNVFFGATILTDYFSFPKPSEEQRLEQKIIADPQFFPYNSAAALRYYISDKTITETYKHLFFLGWPFAKTDSNDYKAYITGKKDQETITGGAKQENPAHLLEMMSACAAIHFYNMDIDDLKNMRNLKCWFKAIGVVVIDNNTNKPVIEYKDLMPEGTTANKGPAAEMSRKLQSFYSFCLMIKTEFDGKIENFIANLRINNFSVTSNQSEAIDYFINYFTYEVKLKKNIPMWLQQIHYTLDKNEAFLGIPKESFYVGDGQPKWNFVKKLKDKNHPYDIFLATLKEVNNGKCETTQELFENIYAAYGKLV